jgi:guanylate kinase
MKGNLFIISSPSGGGKGTLIRELLRTVPNIGYSISFTTRGARAGEVNGSDYFFIEYPEFEKLIGNGEFLEFAVVHGNYYGTSRTQVKTETESGRDVILEIDVQGAESIKRAVPAAVGIFILPPAYAVLRERLIARRTETEIDLLVRLKNGRAEVERYTEFDYVVINDDVVKAADDLRAIICAERLKTERQQERIGRILDTFEQINHKATREQI